MKGFSQFLHEQGVMGLAVGFILGGAVSNLVGAIVEDIINPLVGLIVGQAGGLANWTVGIGDANLLVGHLITIFIDFVIIAAVVYFVVRALKLDKEEKE